MENLVRRIIASITLRAKKFAKDTNGNIGILFGLSAIPVFLAAGCAIDYARIANAKTNLVASLDSSALYAAAITDKTEAQMKDLARLHLNRNYTNTSDAALSAFDLHNFADRVEATGTVKVKTWFMSVGGISNVDVNASSQVMKSGTSIEVSLVLDVTASMNTSVGSGTKISNLRDAANNFVDKVVSSDQTQYYSKVALIPFSVGVNMGSSANADAARGTLTAGTCSMPGCAKYQFNFGGVPLPYGGTYSITNCVTERTGAQKYTDADVSSNPVGRHYAAAPPAYANDTDICNGIQPLVPLTSDRTVLHNAIDALVPGGGTAGQVGMAWGWYTISPTFGLWTGSSVPAAYPTASDNLKKIAVFMTDGDFTASYCDGVLILHSIVCGGATNGDPTDQALSLCSAMKAKGITIYTIGFDLGHSLPAARTFMANCATDSNKAFDAANSADLNAAFAAIAKNLMELRVSR
jgi:Flp pilus assembly protein TadG